MVLLLTVLEAQQKICDNVRVQRLKSGLTQQELSKRSGVPLPSVRKFEQTGKISFESFLKIQMALGLLEQVVDATLFNSVAYKTMDDVINNRPINTARRKRGKKYDV